MKRRYQSGLTITELLISVALGMGIISAVLLAYLASHTSAMNTLASSRLNQELGTLMNLMASELRRDGYTAAVDSPGFPLDNAFNLIDHTALAVFDSPAGNNRQGVTGRGSCIVFAYDRNQDGVVDADELGGFRLNAGAVEIRTAGSTADPGSCASAGNTWVDLTDAAFVTVTLLDFDLAASRCLNSREPDEVDNDGNGVIDNDAEADCYAQVPAAGSGDLTVETREIRITLAGQLTNDTFVSRTLEQDVRVRNDLVRAR